MKKIVSLLMGLVVMASATFAQPKMKAKEGAKPKMEKAAKQAAPKADPTAPAAAAGVPMKKDGTPDKRFKAAKKAEGPVKKDGTPDMRFKKNKTETKKAA